MHDAYASIRWELLEQTIHVIFHVVYDYSRCKMTATAFYRTIYHAFIDLQSMYIRFADPTNFLSNIGDFWDRKANSQVCAQYFRNYV